MADGSSAITCNPGGFSNYGGQSPKILVKFQSTPKHKQYTCTYIHTSSQLTVTGTGYTSASSLGVVCSTLSSPKCHAASFALVNVPSLGGWSCIFCLRADTRSAARSWALDPGRVHHGRQVTYSTSPSSTRISLAGAPLSMFWRLKIPASTHSSCSCLISIVCIYVCGVALLQACLGFEYGE